MASNKGVLLISKLEELYISVCSLIKMVIFIIPTFVNCARIIGFLFVLQHLHLPIENLLVKFISHFVII